MGATHTENLLGKTLELIDKSPDIQGYIDAADLQCITGWVWNKNVPEAPMVVISTLDDGSQRVALADQYRDDLMQAGIGDGCHAFTINLAGKCPHVDEDGILSVQVLGTERNLEFSAGTVFNSHADGANSQCAANTSGNGHVNTPEKSDKHSTSKAISTRWILRASKAGCGIAMRRKRPWSLSAPWKTALKIWRWQISTVKISSKQELAMDVMPSALVWVESVRA